jgi:isopentenyl-diphosphate delta-isomerase
VTDILVLVDGNDGIVGYEKKERCHLVPTKLHRAFSIFIFNSKGEMLIHRRGPLKKTWPGYWTNACCSHPRKGETLETATMRRLREELGFETPLTHLFSFRYEADYDGQYGENEIDHVFLGIYDGKINQDRDEIEDWRFIDIKGLMEDINVNPETYTPWFKEAMPDVLTCLSDLFVPDLVLPPGIAHKALVGAERPS